MTARRFWRRAVAVGATLIAGAGLLMAPTPAGAASEGCGYEFVSANSGLVADVAGAAVDDGAPVIQWLSTGDDNQRWVPLPLPDGSFVLVNLNSNMVLDVAGSSTDNGAAIVQSEWDGSATQLWRQYAFGPDFVVFINVGSGRALDVAGASVETGTGLIQWDWNGGANQLWQGIASCVVA